MPHRDDREAARHRIDALERQLEDERARAERAEQEARAAKDALERRAHEPPSARRPASVGAHSGRDDGSEAPDDPRWPRLARARFERAAAAAVLALNAPTVLLFTARHRDLDDADASLLGWSLLPSLVFLPVVYLLARRFRAPFPASSVAVSLLAGGLGWMALLLASSDMLWGDVLAEPPGRWLTRGAAGLLAIGFHALLAARWSSQAVLADPTPAGD